MKSLVSFVIGILLGAAAVGIAAPKSFPIHIGPPPKTHLLGATASGSTMNVGRSNVSLFADGSHVVSLNYSSQTTGNILAQRQLNVPASSASAILDSFGTVVFAGGTWGTYASCVSTYLTCLDNSIGSAAGAGKLNLSMAAPAESTAMACVP